jgi:glutathione S-transferase
MRPISWLFALLYTLFRWSLRNRSSSEQAVQNNDFLENVRAWLKFDRLTMADLCCYPLVSVADEAKIDRSRYLAVEKWVARIEQLPIPPRPSLSAYRKSLQGGAR